MTKTVYQALPNYTPDGAIERLRHERDALIRLCDAQRRKIERQATELRRLRTRLRELSNEPGK